MVSVPGFLEHYPKATASQMLPAYIFFSSFESIVRVSKPKRTGYGFIIILLISRNTLLCIDLPKYKTYVYIHGGDIAVFPSSFSRRSFTITFPSVVIH